MRGGGGGGAAAAAIAAAITDLDQLIPAVARSQIQPAPSFTVFTADGRSH